MKSRILDLDFARKLPVNGSIYVLLSIAYKTLKKIIQM